MKFIKKNIYIYIKRKCLKKVILQFGSSFVFLLASPEGVFSYFLPLLFFLSQEVINL